MLEKNYKLAEMIFLEQVTGTEELDGRGDQRGKNTEANSGGMSTGQLGYQRSGENFQKGLYSSFHSSIIPSSVLVLTITSFFHKKSAVSPYTPEPVSAILARGGRSRFCEAQSLYNLRSPL